MMLSFSFDSLHFFQKTYRWRKAKRWSNQFFTSKYMYRDITLAWFVLLQTTLFSSKT